MENHASASMYIPSSKVLARLQRHAAAMGQSKSKIVSDGSSSVLSADPVTLRSTSSSTLGALHDTAPMDTLAALSDSPTKTTEAATLVEKCAAVLKSSGAGGSCTSAHGASSGTSSLASHDHPIGASPPSESATSGAALVVHNAAPDAATPPSLAPSATPPNTFKSPAASRAFSPQIPGSNTSSGRATVGAPTSAEACGAASRVLSAPGAILSSPVLPPSASLPPSSAWLLPQEDVTYIFSSLTWNVELLRLLLPHAPCPLRLPDAESPAEVPPSIDRERTAAAVKAPTATPATPTSRSSDMNEEEVDAEAQQEGLSVKFLDKNKTEGAAAAVGASSTGTLQPAQADQRSDASNIMPKMEASAGDQQAKERTRQSTAATATGVAPDPRSPPPTLARVTNVMVVGTSAALSTVPLTWSQYLFRGAGGDVRAVAGAQRGGAAPVQGASSTLPHSQSDGALAREPKTTAGPPAGLTAAPQSSVSSSIFHAQYLPSLEEFQRKLEEHKHRQHLRQQQQQQPPTLSATRLQQHLQQQQQQQPSQSRHRCRRAATNKTFFYSPTPSVISLATTAATTTVNANPEHEYSEEEKQQQRQLSYSGATATSPRSPPVLTAARGNSSAAFSGVWSLSSSPPSPPSSSPASQTRRHIHQSHHLLDGNRIPLRRCTSSTSSLDHLGGDDEEAEPGVGATAVISQMLYSTPHSSRPSPSQPPHPSVMMRRAADRLCASIMHSSARTKSPLLLLRTHDVGTNRGSRASSGAAAREDGGGNERGEEDEEWTSSRHGTSGSGGGVWPSSSCPASPTVSISAMSFSRVWSRTVSGRATPRTTLATGVGSGCSYASPYSTTKGGRNARRRRKAMCTRRRRTMRVYMPSITEGPKAASLYTAPTAEAQELLLLLQHRAASSSLTSGVTGRSMGGHGASTTSTVFSMPSTPRTYSMVAGARVPALPAATTSTTPPVLQPSGVAARPRPSTFAEAARARCGSGSGSSNGTSAGVVASRQQQQQRSLASSSVTPSMAPRSPGEAERTPHFLTPSHSKCALTPPAPALIAGTSFTRLPSPQAIVSEADSSTVRAADGSPASAVQEQHPHPPRPTPLLSAPRAFHCSLSPLVLGAGSEEVHPFGGSAASSPQSHEAATDSSSASWSGVVPAPPPEAAAVPTSRSFTPAGSSGGGEAGDVGNQAGVAGRADVPRDIRTDRSAEAHHLQSSTPVSSAGPATPVELPQWVRERPLSALYYQPWGLELLARYEAARHDQQLMRARIARRVRPGVGSNTTAATSAVSEVGVSGNENKPPSSAASMHNSSVTSLSSMSSPSAPISSSYMTSTTAATTAAQHAPVLSRSSLGTSRGGCAHTVIATGAGGPSPTPSPSTPSISWAAALRQPQRTYLTCSSNNSSGGGFGLTTATTEASKITATTTMNNCTTTTTTTTATAAVTLLQQHPLRRPPAVVPEWPPELSAAEERDAWEEAYYFGRVAAPSSPSLPQSQPQRHQLPASHSTTKLLSRMLQDTKLGQAEGENASTTADLAGCMAGSSGQVGGRVSSSRVPSTAAASAAVLMRQQWWLNKEIQPPTLYLSRQRRTSRRRSRAAYPSDTFRSSAARRAGATSAAAELFHKRKDAHLRATIDATAVAPTCVEAVGEAAPVSNAAVDPPAGSSSTFTSSAARGDLTLYNDSYPRKKAAQLFYPVASLHSGGTPPLPPAPPHFFDSDHRTLSQGAGTSRAAAALLPVSALGDTDAIERGGDIADAQQQQEVEEEGIEVGSSAAGGQITIETSAALQKGNAVEQVVENDGAELDAAGIGFGWRPPNRLSTDDPHRTGSDLVSGVESDAAASRPRDDVDVIFFLQKFIRAALIVFIVQVRLRQLQKQRERELQADSLHSATCPAGAYQLDPQAQGQWMRLKGRHGGHPSRGKPPAAAAAAEGSEEGGLSKLERCALSFVRRYMADYRHMITAYVMRDDREVARRSAQAIFSPPRSAASALSMLLSSADTLTGTTPGATDRTFSPTPDPLFQQDVLARCLNAARVTTAYEEAVRAATCDLPCSADENPPATPLDDVESLRTAQVYISGKDAAWQPLLMELLQVSRIVQCYSDGPAVTAPAASVTTPQQLLLENLEKFLAQPTLPLLRHAGPDPAVTAQALATTLARPAAASTGTITAASSSLASDMRTTMTPSLTPVQEAAAALMVEESDAFRNYLLSGYLRNKAAGDSTASAATTETTTLRHSQSAPTLSARATQPRQQPLLSSAAAMPSCPVTCAMSQQPESPSPLFSTRSLLQPLVWYPYAHMPGTANPYAEGTDPSTTHITPAQAATASSMTLYVTMLPLSGKLLWRWVVPAEDTDNFNLSVFFQSSLFSFMQGGPLPMPSAAPAPGEWTAAATAAAAAVGAAGFVPTPMTVFTAPPPSPHPSLTWPPALAARIDVQLRSDAFISAWGEVPPPCMCGAAATVDGTSHRLCAGGWVELPEVTLVHCSAGMHRSCGILIAFLLWLLYQCRQVLRTEQTLALHPLSGTRAPAHPLHAGAEAADDAALKALLLDGRDALAPAEASAADMDASWMTSCLLQRAIRHVHQQRSIAVPIRTVQCLLQSFANELQLT
nr:hypothetical protein, conserved [Leishmania guyanensis]